MRWGLSEENMRDISEVIQESVLDFDSDRRIKWEQERKPYSVIFELTPKCNMNCIHCYLQDSHLEEQLSTEEIFELLDLLCDRGILFITFTGGEVFTRKDFLDIYMYAKRKGFFVEIFTNGSLITDSIIKVLKEYPPILVDISLYGACEETYRSVTGLEGAFSKVITNCKKLTDAGIRTALKSPILTVTYDELPEMKALAQSLGIQFRPSFEIITTIEGNAKTKGLELPVDVVLEYEFNERRTRTQKLNDNEERFGKPDDLFRCKIGVTGFVIDYKGNICPCMKFRHKGQKLTRNNFDDIWRSYGEYKKLKYPEGHKCLACKAIDYCDVCPAEMDFLKNDMYYRCDSNCAYANKRYQFYSRLK